MFLLLRLRVLGERLLGFVLLFKTVFHYVLQAVLELAILLSLPYKCWDDRQVPTDSEVINLEGVTWKTLAATQRAIGTGLCRAGSCSVFPEHPHS